MNIYEVRHHIKSLFFDKKKNKANEHMPLLSQEKKELVDECLHHLDKAIACHEALKMDVLQHHQTTSFRPDDLQEYKNHLDRAQLILGALIIHQQHNKKSKLNTLLDRMRINLGMSFKLEPRHVLLALNHSLKHNRAKLNSHQLNWMSHIKNKQQLFENFKENIQFLMNQSLLPALGTSHGECYGFCFAYANYRENNMEDAFQFTKEVSQLQKRQFSKSPKGAKYYPKRLCKTQYQPDLLMQANDLIKYAKANQDKHLSICLTRIGGRHATYLQHTSNGKWHYFDSNVGAFEFNTPESFKAFYQALYTPKNGNFTWHSYEVSELMTQPPENTWGGKLRSILTGAKYESGMRRQYYSNKIAIGLLALGVGVAVGVAALILLAPMIALPVGITIAGIALASVLKGAMVIYAGASMAASIVYFNNLANKMNFRGLLGLPRAMHYLFSKAISSPSSSPNKAHDSENKLSAEDEINAMDPTLQSYIKMLDGFSDVPQPASNPDTQPEEDHAERTPDLPIPEHRMTVSVSDDEEEESDNNEDYETSLQP